MASLNPSKASSINANPITITPLHSSLIPRTSQLFVPRNFTHLGLARKLVSCKASKHNDPQNHDIASKTNTEGQSTRRDMLIGLGGLYGATATFGTAGTPAALADPAVPDTTKCYPTDGSGGGPPGMQCCPPVYDPSKVVDFDPRNYPSPRLRMRPSAHEVAKDEKYMQKFYEAIRRMKCLPASDPRSFIQQANVHCAYCDGSYRQLGYPKLDFQIHSSWLFFPFHRCYLFFFERILGKLIDDPSFAIPYWNWDEPKGMQIPSIYASSWESPLYDPLRDAKHQPPTVIDLSYNGVNTDTPKDVQICYNLVTMYEQVVVPRWPELFMGSPYRAGSQGSSPGTLERKPHNTVHNWTGDPNQPYGEDMGVFFSAARDPIFYGHHSNVDRMWYIWNKLDGGRPNFNDPDWLNAYFVFYDENAQPVRIYVRDCLDTEKQLGYAYHNVDDLPWFTNRVCPSTKSVTREISPKQTTEVTFPKPLDSVVRTQVKRPRKSRSKQEKKQQEEVLVVNLELVKEDVYVKFDVYINDQYDHDAGEVTEVLKEYAGSFTSLPHRPNMHGHGGHNMNTGFKMAMSELIDRIGADNDDSVEVTLVPRAGIDAVVINDVKIEFLP